MDGSGRQSRSSSAKDLSTTRTRTTAGTHVIFEHPQYLQQRADRLVVELADAPEMEVTPSAIEWLEEFDDRPEDQEVAQRGWAASPWPTYLTKTTKNLQRKLCRPVALMLGPQEARRRAGFNPVAPSTPWLDKVAPVTYNGLVYIETALGNVGTGYNYCLLYLV